jgi:hypothetical protein
MDLDAFKEYFPQRMVKEDQLVFKKDNPDDIAFVYIVAAFVNAMRHFESGTPNGLRNVAMNIIMIANNFKTSLKSKFNGCILKPKNFEECRKILELLYRNAVLDCGEDSCAVPYTIDVENVKQFKNSVVPTLCTARFFAVRLAVTNFSDDEVSSCFSLANQLHSLHLVVKKKEYITKFLQKVRDSSSEFSKKLKTFNHSLQISLAKGRLTTYVEFRAYDKKYIRAKYVPEGDVYEMDRAEFKNASMLKDVMKEILVKFIKDD